MTAWDPLVRMGTSERSEAARGRWKVSIVKLLMRAALRSLTLLRLPCGWRNGGDGDCQEKEDNGG